MINYSFTQSDMWDELLAAQKKEFWKEEIHIENNKIIEAHIIVEDLPLGYAFAYIPYGPTLFSEKKDEVERAFQKLVENIKNKKTSKKIINIKIEPNLEINHFFHEILKQHGTKSQKNYQPQETILLDITKPEEELLNSFHKKTRYNIRLAKRKGVEIKISTNPEDIDIFNTINQVTQQRNKFSINTEKYYKTQFEILSKQNTIKLFTANYKNTPIAANICVFYKNQATYLHGASSNEHRNVMAPHLLQWEQILDAKNQNCSTYDFWGATSSENPKHSWHGVTRFKKGFNEVITTYIPAHDIILNKTAYNAIEAGKKTRRAIKNILK